jgi:hypothetical protein
MKPEVLAQARRYYHHVLHGGTLRPSDVAFMVEALEEAANQRKMRRTTRDEKIVRPGIYEVPIEEPKREWVGLTDEEIEEVVSFPWHYIPFARAIEAKLKEKNT